MGRVLDAFDASVNAAVKDGTLDASKHGVTIEAARKVASVLDEPDWPIVRGKLDNVSPSVFLKYCDALGLTPGELPEKQKPKGKKLDALVVKGKFSKAANG